MIVVADASPIISLSAIGHFDLLRRLYGEVRVPTAVFEEVTSVEDVRPGSVEVRQAKWLIEHPLSPQSAELACALQLNLDQGEAEAIALAVEVEAGLLLMDERRGRHSAAQLGISVAGVLGVLMEAKKKGFVDELKPLLDELLSEAGMRFSQQLYRRVLQEAGEAKPPA